MWYTAEITPRYKERMHDLLNLFAEPYDGDFPVVCMDEKSKQFTGLKGADAHETGELGKT